MSSSLSPPPPSPSPPPPSLSPSPPTGRRSQTQSWKVLLPQKFDKQVFDGWRNDPRDVPRMAPLRLPEARAREAGRH